MTTPHQSDRELLEAAAKAYGDDAITCRPSGCFRWIGYDENVGCDVRVIWNPLDSDGDALRLAVKLNLLVMPYPLDNAVRVTRLDQPDTIVSFGTPPDPYAATRRAIVRAAAEIGRTL